MSIDRSDYLRITQVLSPFTNYASIPQNILDHAADRGTRVHTYCELYALGLLFGDIDSDCLPYVNAFKQWFDIYVDYVVKTEERYYCDDLKITGQIDLIVKLHGHFEYCIVDIKTSVKPSKTWDLQTAAYQYLCLQNFMSVDNRFALHLTRDGTFDLIGYDDYEKKLSVFISLLDGYVFFNPFPCV